MNHLLAYDRHYQPIGVLVSAYDITRVRRINSEYALTFMVPMSSDDYRDKLTLKGHIRDERGQFYVINSRRRVREDRKLTAQIMCQHIMFKLADYKVPYSEYVREGYGIHITQLLNKIAASTGGRFSFSVDDTFDLYDVKDWGRGNCLQALNDVVNLYGAEIDPDNSVIHIRKKIGNPASEMRYQLGRNIVSADYSDDGSALVTRLFATMKDSRTWIGQPATILTAEERALLEAVPGAIVNGVLQVNYLISPYAAAWASESVPFYDGEFAAQDITDPAELLRKAREQLRKMEQPVLELAIRAADLYKIDASEPRPNLGDTVTCIDPEIDLLEVTARITEMTEYPFNADKHAEITVANVMRRDSAQLMADLDRARQVITDAMSGGRIRAEVFEEFARLAVHDINNSKTELIYPPEGGILAQDKLDSRNQVRLTSAGLGISTDGWQTVRSAITARGIVAEQVIGQLGNFVSMAIGSGNNITKINTNGISAGHDDFNSAPFRVDMAGNVIANSLTANYANINMSNFRDGEITGSSINVGDGRFTVSREGDVYAEGGIFAGGTITGARIRTGGDGIYPRVEIDPSTIAFGVYSSPNDGILIPAYDGGVSKIIFNANGNQSVIYNSPSSGFIFNGYSNVQISGNGIKLDPGAGSVVVPSFSDLYEQLTGTTLRGELDALWSALSMKANENHSHYLSLPDHNHGNPQNQDSGGGTYAVY